MRSLEPSLPRFYSCKCPKSRHMHIGPQENLCSWVVETLTPRVAEVGDSLWTFVALFGDKTGDATPTVETLTGQRRSDNSRIWNTVSRLNVGSSVQAGRVMRTLSTDSFNDGSDFCLTRCNMFMWIYGHLCVSALSSVPSGKRMPSRYATHHSKADDFDRGRLPKYQEEDFGGDGPNMQKGGFLVRRTGGWRRLGVWRRILILALVSPLRVLHVRYPNSSTTNLALEQTSAVDPQIQSIAGGLNAQDSGIRTADRQAGACVATPVIQSCVDVPCIATGVQLL